MFTNVLIAIKPGIDAAPLLALAARAAPPPAVLHLVSLLRVGTNEDEMARLQGAQRYLEGKATDLRDQGYSVTTDVSIIVAAAAADLARIANDHDADLMVIGLAKRSRVGKALLGSDAQRVLLSARCPVLVTHLFGA